MLSEPLRWRALTWFPYWAAVVVMTLVYSMAVGLAVEASLPIVDVHGTCVPSRLHALVSSWGDVVWFPLKAAMAAFAGAYLSGLEAGFCAALLALAPAALLSLDRAQRVFRLPVIGLVAALLFAGAWFAEIHTLQTDSQAACRVNAFHHSLVVRVIVRPESLPTVAGRRLFSPGSAV